MTNEEIKLWQKISAFELDDPAVDFKFSARLARENGWTKEYTARVIDEYKRFIFLCCITETGVTPSDPVDQAWHLHLTFTRSYWIDLCKNTLGKEIHHNPTKGGKHEAEKFDGFYTSSQTLYASKFGTPPPADVWQNNHDRFSDINFRRVNLGKYWLVKKPEGLLLKLTLPILLLSAGLFIQASESTIIPFLIFVVVVIAIGVYRDNNASQNKRNHDGNGSGGDGCSAGCSTSHHGGQHGGDSGCSSGCSGCSSSGCSGCGGGCGGD